MFDFDKIDLSKICRSCLLETESLYDQYSTDMSVADMFLYITSLECPSNYDDLPIQICQDCVCQLRISYKFVLKSRESNTKIQNYLLNIRKPSDAPNNDSINVKSEDGNSTNVLLASQSTSCLNAGVKSEIDKVLESFSNVLPLENNEVPKYILNLIVQEGEQIKGDDYEQKYEALKEALSMPEIQIEEDSIKNELDPLREIKLEDDQTNKDFKPPNNEVTFEHNYGSLKLPITITEMHIDVDKKSNLIKDKIDNETLKEACINYKYETEIIQENTNEPMEESIPPVIVLNNLKLSNFRMVTNNVVSKEIPKISNTAELASDHHDVPKRQTSKKDGKCKKPTQNDNSNTAEGDQFDITSIIQNVKIEQALLNKCKNCNVNFLTYGFLLDHYRVVKYPNMKLQCRYCPEVYESRYLFEHTKFKHRYRMNKLFTVRVRENEQENPNSTTVACAICYKCFNHKRNLNLHIVTHNGEKPYPCTHCRLSFDQSNKLKNHLYMHNVYSCTLCDQYFNQSITLTRHRLTHIGEKPVPNKL